MNANETVQMYPKGDEYPAQGYQFNDAKKTKMVIRWHRECFYQVSVAFMDGNVDPGGPDVAWHFFEDQPKADAFIISESGKYGTQ